MCPLCSDSHTRDVAVVVSKRRFLRCATCNFLWVPQEEHISEEEERERYLRHNNSPEDDGYRAFLSRMCSPMITFLSAGARGLDFGSGPNSVLSKMLTLAGFQIDTYDPVFGPYTIKRERYDFVTSTEVVEHFREPRKDLDRMCKLVSTGGYLGIMTQEVPEDPLELEHWFYFRDSTHVSFFSERPITWWSSQVGLETVYRGEGVWILQKV
jgi:hypothetical protein